MGSIKPFFIKQCIRKIIIFYFFLKQQFFSQYINFAQIFYRNEYLISKINKHKLLMSNALHYQKQKCKLIGK
jgi:hypothetical protein